MSVKEIDQLLLSSFKSLDEMTLEDSFPEIDTSFVKEEEVSFTTPIHTPPRASSSSIRDQSLHRSLLTTANFNCSPVSRIPISIHAHRPTSVVNSPYFLPSPVKAEFSLDKNLPEDFPSSIESKLLPESIPDDILTKIEGDIADVIPRYEHRSLTDTDWDLLRIICGHLDSYTYPPVSEFNIDAINGVIAARGLPRPSAQLMDVLMMTAQKVSGHWDSYSPWSSALCEVELDINEYDHEDFVERKLKANYELAVDTVVHNIERGVFQNMKRARIRAQESHKLLQKCIKHATKQYFKLWRVQASQNAAQRAKTDAVVARTTALVGLRKWRHETHCIRDINPLNHLDSQMRKKFFGKWLDRTNMVLQLDAAQVALAVERRTTQCVLRRLNHQAKSSLMRKLFLQRNIFRAWLQRLQRYETKKKDALNLLKRRFVKRAISRTGEITRISATDHSANQKLVLKRKYFITWKRNMQVVELQRSNDNILAHRVLKEWRRNLCAVLVEAKSSQKLGRIMLKRWVESHRNLEQMNELLHELDMEVNLAHAEHFFGEIQRQYEENMSQTSRAQDLCVEHLKVHGLKKVMTAYKLYQESLERADKLKIHIELKNAMTLMKKSYECHRDERLHQIEVDIKRVVHENAAISILYKLRQRAQGQQKCFAKLTEIQDRTVRENVLKDWRAAREVIQSKKLEIIPVLNRGTKTKALQKWKVEYVISVERNMLAQETLMLNNISACRKHLRLWQTQALKAMKLQEIAEARNKSRIKQLRIEKFRHWRYAALGTAGENSASITSPLFSARYKSTPNRFRMVSPRLIKRLAITGDYTDSNMSRITLLNSSPNRHLSSGSDISVIDTPTKPPRHSGRTRR